MFEPLPTPEEMARWDQAAINDVGIPGAVLMENAARAAFDALVRAFGSVQGKRALILAGPGNNGGDGFALARRLNKAGALVTILHSKPLTEYRHEAGLHAALAKGQGLDLTLLAPTPPFLWPVQVDVIIDALLGTGLRGPAKAPFSDWIDLVNTLTPRPFVLALDLPSGLDAHTGEPRSGAVRADLTVTFETAKTGLIQPTAREFVGRLEVVEIGIPQTIIDGHPPKHRMMTQNILANLPKLSIDMHKGHAGRILVLGGSRGMAGAPVLTGLAALRTGAGLVTVAGPDCVVGPVTSSIPDLMFKPLRPNTGWTPESISFLGDLTAFDALVLGPGLGRDPLAGAFVEALLDRIDPSTPLVLDADALFHLAAKPRTFRPRHRVILTPHPGEAARLLGTSASSHFLWRSETVRALAESFQAVVVLKGAMSLVTSPNTPVAVSPFSEPCLAVAGSGDVLAGLVGALLGRGMEPLTAACLGVYWHGMTGRFLSQVFPLRGNLATDIADALPQAIKECPQCSVPEIS